MAMNELSVQIDTVKLSRDFQRILGPIPRKVLQAQDWAEMDTVRWMQSQMVRRTAAASGVPQRVFRGNAAYSRRPVPKRWQRAHPRFNEEPREAWLGTNPILAHFLGKVRENEKKETVSVGRRRYQNAKTVKKPRLGRLVLRRAGDGWEQVKVDVAGPAAGAMQGLREEAASRYQQLLMRRMARVLRSGVGL